MLGRLHRCKQARAAEDGLKTGCTNTEDRGWAQRGAAGLGGHSSWRAPQATAAFGILFWVTEKVNRGSGQRSGMI